MALLQKRVLADQLGDHCRSGRLCSVCARTRAIKDCRQRIDTIFGRLRVAAPRYERCQCGADRQPASPVSALFPGRVLPKLLGLQARFGGDLPYRQATAILTAFLPEATCFSHATTRNRFGEDRPSDRDRVARRDQGRHASRCASSGDGARHRRLLREGHQQKPQNEPRDRSWTDRGSYPQRRSVCCCPPSGWPREAAAEGGDVTLRPRTRYGGDGPVGR
jgi:hypothetical protein